MSIRFLVDEDFDNDILRGVLRRMPRLDIVRAQDVGLKGAADPTVLAWAANENRVLLTHDVSTMSDHAYRRVGRGQLMPGVFSVSQSLDLRTAIDEVLLIAECSLEGEWEGQVHRLPL
jgi:hypothetical protein